MFRLNALLLRKSPLETLGLMANATPEEAKARFQELARIHHPDMPTGCPNKFREIHAAYQLVRAGKGNETGGEGPDGKPYRSESGATAQRYYGRNHARHKGSQNVTAEDIRKMKEEAERIKREQNRTIFSDMSPQAMAGGGLAALIVAFGLYRSWAWLRDPYGEDDLRSYGLSGDIDGFGAKGGIYASSSSSSSRSTRTVSMEESLRSQFSEESFPSAATSSGSSPSSSSASSSASASSAEEASAAAAAAEEARRQKEAAILRENRMRRYDDLREYYYVNDPEGAGSRRYTSERIMASFIDAELVPMRCPLYVELPEGAKSDIVSYDRALTEVVERRLGLGGSAAAGAIPSFASPSSSSASSAASDSGPSVRLARLDQEAVALHTVAALGRIPKMSPSQVPWTFVEYRDSEVRGSVPTCLVAIRNLRFAAGEGFAQRVVVSGSEELQPLAAHKARVAALKTGEVRARDFATTGVVPARVQLMKAPPPE